MRLAAGVVGAALVLQWLIGMNLIWQGFPLWIGAAHNAGAALVLLATLALVRGLSPARVRQIRGAMDGTERHGPSVIRGDGVAGNCARTAT